MDATRTERKIAGSMLRTRALDVMRIDPDSAPVTMVHCSQGRAEEQITIPSTIFDAALLVRDGAECGVPAVIAF
jgi:hypothetical protein